jgi:hypothetical protein
VQTSNKGNDCRSRLTIEKVRRRAGHCGARRYWSRVITHRFMGVLAPHRVATSGGFCGFAFEVSRNQHTGSPV